jgi:hypothetical protein
MLGRGHVNKPRQRSGIGERCHIARASRCRYSRCVSCDHLAPCPSKGTAAMNGISSSRLAFVKAMSQPSAMPEIVITGWARPAKGRPRQRPSGRLCGSHSLPIAAGGIPLRRRYLAFRRSLPSFWALSGVSSGSIPAGKGQNDSIETGDWSATAFPRGQAASERGHCGVRRVDSCPPNCSPPISKNVSGPIRPTPTTERAGVASKHQRASKLGIWKETF